MIRSARALGLLHAIPRVMQKLSIIAGALCAAVLGCAAAPQAAHRSNDTVALGGREDHGQAVSSSKLYTCGDPVLNEQITSGGEQLTAATPCWGAADEADLEGEAPKPTGVARARETHRGELASAQLVSCRGISERELTHSPFAHRRSILEVVPHREGTEVHGVRVIFKQVPGLTAAWLEKAISCHQARHAALGHPAEHGTNDPSLVDGAEVRVTSHLGTIEVVITTEDPSAGKLAYERARELAAPRAARR